MDQIIRQQVDLSYYANIPPQHTDDMAIFEMERYYDRLIEIKKEEEEKVKEKKKEINNK